MTFSTIEKIFHNWLKCNDVPFGVVNYKELQTCSFVCHGYTNVNTLKPDVASVKQVSTFFSS